MREYSCIFFWMGFLLAAYAWKDGQQDQIDTYFTVEGHFYKLNCDLYTTQMDNQTLSWSRDDNHTLDVTSQRIKKMEDSLWFLPVKLSDSGYYTCSNRRNITKMILSVESGFCPRQSDIKQFQLGTTRKLSCRQDIIFTIGQKVEVNWLKDCNPLGRHDQKILMRNITEKSAGKYTCQINFIYENRNYTASWTTLLKVKNEPVLLPPKVMRPRNETVAVKAGLNAELECKAFIGLNEKAMNETVIYWMFNYTFINQYQDLSERLEFLVSSVKQGSSKVYSVSRLSIGEVRKEFFHVPFRCIVYNSVGRDVGLIQLTPANDGTFYIHVLICVVIPMAVISVVYCFFKVDLVLAFRGMRQVFCPNTISDGKLYDAYVSYLHHNNLCSSHAENFVMHILPEVLEGLHGYKLFIRGRDNLPGEAIHDIIADTVRKSRRMIIVVSTTSPNDLDQNERLNQFQDVFEQQIGLYDALIKDTLQVILLEMDENIDYSLLPESVKYVKQKQGALRWKPCRGDPTAPPNRRFWKVLRYHMSVTRSQSVMEPILPTTKHPQAETNPIMHTV
uniref:Interleukin-1 receptor type 1-like n=1 Tax=Paramormyrops kingsleyae TaxID=1676925 RepID=A0A3B3R8E4_9TELE|nr:interleukin-1 receptor type 1-like isoform X1 [Paramormyrops kingsleyae]